MDWPFLVAIALVATVGLASSWNNWTARALVANFAIVTGYWAVTGEGPLQLRVIADYLVLIVIFVMAGDDGVHTPGALGWAKDLWRQLSWWDQAVVWLFLPSWVTYAVAMPPVWSYWIAWTAGVLQLFAAGGEAFETWRRGRALAKADNPTDISMSRQGLVVNEC